MAILLENGYTKTYFIDYEQTFSLLEKINTIRILLSLVSQWSWELCQFDVNNDFLQGDLKEEMYTEITFGIDITGGTNNVC